MKLLVSGIVSGAAVMAIVYMADREPKISGLLLLLPVMSLVSIIAIAMNSPPGIAREVVKSTIIALPVWIMYLVTLYFCLGKMAWPQAVGFALLSWVVMAVIFTQFNW